MKYVTRIAPSPTGFAHFGTFRTAYFSWLAARATGGSFIVRIDDTDAARNNEATVRPIYDTLEWLGLDYDKTFRQSERFGHYRDVAENLCSRGLAYHPDDTPLVRLTDAALEHMPAYFNDLTVGKVEITKTALEQTRGMVCIKSDANPTYNFCSILDDYDHDVNFIIRGVDHIANTGKQLCIWNCLGGREVPLFSHVGLVNFNKKKLSKRDGAASMLWYKDEGYDPEAVLNLMLRLGWGPKVDDATTAVLDRTKALELFLEGGRMRGAPSNLDLNLLKALDRKHKARSRR